MKNAIFSTVGAVGLFLLPTLAAHGANDEAKAGKAPAGSVRLTIVTAAGGG